MAVQQMLDEESVPFKSKSGKRALTPRPASGLPQLTPALLIRFAPGPRALCQHFSRVTAVVASAQGVKNWLQTGSETF